ncbi:MAG: tripartite tricarboxylate transporter substrate binding protein [Burkholderiales bacterium]
MKHRCGMLSVLVLALFAAAQTCAQYPGKPLRLIVPFPPGGGTDTLARVYGQKLGDALGQQVIIDNRPGGGTNIGAEIAAKALPDGYTALMGNIAHAINVTLYSKLAYDLVRDFAPVSLLASTPNILVVHPSIPAKTVKELIVLARSRPGQLDYASSGSGSSSHLAAELFSSMTEIKMTHIPYKGGGPAVVALAGGQVSVGFATTPSVVGHIKSGKLRGLAVTTAQRSPSTPDLPTISEAGVPGYDAGTWYGLLVPAGTPREIVIRLHTESLKLLKQPDVKERLDSAGFEVIGNTPEQFAAFIRAEIDKWARVVKASGARAE